ncbi:MAG: DUF4340 domain-containing protein [Dehalococcoidia bacterium]|nr:DUF4340 domain-containing protein [Dehalococcoidia bacterium]MSQ16239.1 DUF4340 domain-containing protein [Dehalococcoidia bacterium]
MNVRLSILLVAVLIFFGGTFLVVKLTRAPDKTTERQWMYKVDEDDVIHISVSHAGQTVSYDKKPGSEQWFIAGDPPAPVVQARWSATPLLLSGPQVSRVLAASFQNPAAYGLEPPDSRVIVSVRGGLTYEFHMGSPTPDGQNQYARLVGDPELFTVPEIWARVINELATKPPRPPAEGEPAPAKI